jgi:hypothetical protein
MSRLYLSSRRLTAARTPFKGLRLAPLDAGASVMSRLYCGDRREDRLKPKSVVFGFKLPPPYGGKRGKNHTFC